MIQTDINVNLRHLRLIVNEMADEVFLVERRDSVRSGEDEPKNGRPQSKWDFASKINFYRFPHSLHRNSTNFRNSGISISARDASGVLGGLKSDDTLLRMPDKVEIPPDLICMDKPWGNFYIYPDLYQDNVSPMVRIKDYGDLVPTLNEEAGILSVRIVATRISYISKNPINGGHVAIKLSLNCLNLKNVDVLKTYRFIQYLDLSRNYLTTLAVLNDLPYLQYLMASYNQLPELLDYDKAQWFLTEVHFKYNLVSIMRDLKTFWSITILDLSHNNIKAINGLQELRYLRRLDLSFNHIQRLENLNNLRLIWLDVSYNRISGYECSATTGLWTLRHLEYLNVNENMLTSLKILSRCHRLRELHCRNNGVSHVLEVSLYLCGLSNLRSLDLRENPISSQEFYHTVVLRTFPSLLNLDGAEVDHVEQAIAKMEANEDIMTYVNRRLFRMLALQQLSMPRVGPDVPAADTRDPPLIVLAGRPATAKRTLCRRLSTQYPEKVFHALLHTTSACRPEDREAPLFHHVRAVKFKEMLISGDFIAYFEEEGDSFGLSRMEVAKPLSSSPPRVCVTAMSHVGALLLRARGLRPHLVHTMRQDEGVRRAIMSQRRSPVQEHAKRDGFSNTPSDVSLLRARLSARIYIGGILQELLMHVDECRRQRESFVESESTLSQVLESFDEPAIETANESNMMEHSSLHSLYKSSATETSDMSVSAHCAPTISATRTGSSRLFNYESSKMKSVSAPGSVAKNLAPGEVTSDPSAHIYVSTKTGNASALKQTQFKSNASKSKSCEFKNAIEDNGTAFSAHIDVSSSKRSVTFQNKGSLQNMLIDSASKDKPGIAAIREKPRVLHLDDNAPVNKSQKALANVMSCCFQEAFNLDLAPTTELPKSISKKISYPLSSTNDLDLWIDFATETGLARISEVRSKTPQEETLENSSFRPTRSLLTQIHKLDKTFGDTEMGSRLSSENVQAKYPGIFSDTLVVDDVDTAYKKLKKIVKTLVNEQSMMEPLYDIEFSEMNLASIDHRLNKIQKEIAPCRMARRHR